MPADTADTWNEAMSTAILGAHVVVGLTFNTSDGQLDRYEQMHGRIDVADPVRGICVVLEGLREGESFWLPPDTRGFAMARPGDYRLKSTGETVSNPDFTVQFTITMGDPAGEADKPRLL